MTEIQIRNKATQLALGYADESDIPTRFKKRTNKKYDPDSNIEIRFQEQIDRWEEVVNSILNHVADPDQALRFINSNPIIEDGTQSVTMNKDFLDFLDFLIQRRNINECGSSELGSLCMLHGTMQKKIETEIR
ncbi:hypothetical protein [Ekhidna sp.]|uniref:hypothetical protein n=1 Tax=Ekhidna sp. TaxID=2608089 RepID=UPI003CCB9104